jgi:uncharacterized protein
MRLVIAGAALLAFATAASGQPVITMQPGETLLQIQASGEVATQPDVLTINAGAVTTGTTSQEALRANSALTERLIEAIRRSGIDARDIRTRNLAVEPRFARESRVDIEDTRPPRVTGYVARNQLEIRFRDLNRASEIMDALFAAGANEVGNPRFSLTDPRPQQRQAERAALENARAEASNYAAAAGKRLGRLIRIGDRQSWVDPDFDESVVVTGSRVRRTVIEPGEITTRATVYVDYALID